MFLLLLEFLRRNASIHLWPVAVYPGLIALIFLALGSAGAWMLAKHFVVRKRDLPAQRDAKRIAEIGLTDRETDVLIFLVHGYTNKQIAAQLKVAPSTIKSHVKSIFIKLDVSNRTEAASEARALG